MKKIYWILPASALTIISVIAGISLSTLPETKLATNLLEADQNSLSFTAERAVELGNEAMELNDFKTAIERYSAAAQLEPNNAFIFVQLSKAYHQTKNYDKALSNAKHAYELKNDPSTQAIYAYALTQKEQWHDAKQVLDLNLEWEQLGHYTAALLNLNENKTDEAKTELENAEAQGGLLKTESLTAFKEAIQIFEAAQGSDESYKNALLAKAAIDAEEWILAKQFAHKSLVQKSQYRDAWVLMGYAQIQLGAFKEAIDALKEARKIDGVKPEIHYFLGMAEAENQDLEAAAKSMELALLYGFEPAEEVYQKMAEIYEKSNRWEEAISAYEALINLRKTTQTSSAEDYARAVSIALEKSKDPIRAQSLAEQAIENFPATGLGHTLLAQVYLVQSDEDGAKLELAGHSVEKALRYGDHLAEAYFTQGEWYLKNKNIPEAREAFKRAYDRSNETPLLQKAAAERYNTLLIQSNP